MYGWMDVCVCTDRTRSNGQKPRLPRPRASSLPEKVSPATQPDPLVIHPLNDFDWKTQEPRKLRPFKKTYHITMCVCVCV